MVLLDNIQNLLRVTEIAVSTILTLRNGSTQIPQTKLLFHVCAHSLPGSPDTGLYLLSWEKGVRCALISEKQMHPILWYLTDANMSHQQERNFSFS